MIVLRTFPITISIENLQVTTFGIKGKVYYKQRSLLVYLRWPLWKMFILRIGRKKYA